MTEMLVIGSPSLDVLHIKGKILDTAGGAGLYTALAARRSGSQVSLFAPRPDPMPELLQVVENLGIDWTGPRVTASEIPHFEISHAGEKAVYLNFFIGEEERLDPEELPRDLSRYDGVHITALANADQQLRFVEVCRERGAKIISTGTFIDLIRENPAIVKSLIEKSDVFFMNGEETARLFGSVAEAEAAAGKLLFITQGKSGAAILQGGHRTELPAVPAAIVDPTGAGDTFCGATLSFWLQGKHPVMAARQAMVLSAEEIGQVGPAALLQDRQPPEIPLDGRVLVNDAQIGKIAGVLTRIPEAEAFNFVSNVLPPEGHPAAVDYFFLTTLQQFGFWETSGGRYERPLIATLDGQSLKGSAYLYYAYLRRLLADPDFFLPEHQAKVTREEMLEIFRADDGSNPMPALEMHLDQARAYGRDMLALGLTPREIVTLSNQTSTPYATFLAYLDEIGGYKEDPLRKKTNLLALSLHERPENFLALGNGEDIQPVVDYHGMRFCLRAGMIDVPDRALLAGLRERRLLSGDAEWEVRYACYQAIDRLVKVSGMSMGAVDNITFSYIRSHCPETSTPDCAGCAMHPVCTHRLELFQPVMRTVFY